jgi:hypothetical protein
MVEANHKQWAFLLFQHAIQKFLVSAVVRVTKILGRAITEAISRLLPTAAARVRVRAEYV